MSMTTRLGCALALALSAAAPAIAAPATTEQVSGLVRLLGMDKVGAVTANAMLAQSPAFAGVTTEKRTCLAGIITDSFATVSQRHLVTQLGEQGSEHVTAWNTFAATPAGKDFVKVFASQAQSMLPGATGAPLEADPAFKAEQDAFAASPAFQTLVNALGPEVQPNEAEQLQLMQQMQQRCGFELPGAPAA